MGVANVNHVVKPQFPLTACFIVKSLNRDIECEQETCQNRTPRENMSSEEIANVQPVTSQENGEQVAPAVIQQEQQQQQQQETKEVSLHLVQCSVCEL